MTTQKMMTMRLLGLAGFFGVMTCLALGHAFDFAPAPTMEVLAGEYNFGSALVVPATDISIRSFVLIVQSTAQCSWLWGGLCVFCVWAALVSASGSKRHDAWA